MKIIHTPGHTQGSTCFYLNSFERKILIAGDTLFAESIGRTDLPGGSYEQIIASISNKLFTLPDETLVITGHGPLTSIKHEIANNQFFN
jgi:glyoxylase-like metal-dependent hydrolase (beta-lactamase superfamily II)